MLLLVSGLAVWWLVHLFKRFWPVAYANALSRWGEGRVKGLTSALLVVGFVMIVFGYKAAPYIHVYTPPLWATHLNNLLMVIALFLLVSSHGKGLVRVKMRHPMLMAAIIWSFAHLLVNGDLASIVLFAGIAAWADLEIMMINVRQGARPDRPVGSLKGDAIAAAMTIPVFVIVVVIHGYVGPSPFAG